MNKAYRTTRALPQTNSSIYKGLRRYGLAATALALMGCLVAAPAVSAASPNGVSALITVPCTDDARGAACSADSTIELKMFQLLNNDRTALAQASEAGAHATPLQWDPKLAALARAHSQELAASGAFRHASADGTQPSVRLSKAGVQWVSMGENLAMGQTVVRAEAMLMNEPKFQENHRANIVNPTFTKVGVGIAAGPDGMLYITQEFVQVR
jgi:uncharacterized protein YkwD